MRERHEREKDAGVCGVNHSKLSRREDPARATRSWQRHFPQKGVEDFLMKESQVSGSCVSETRTLRGGKKRGGHYNIAPECFEEVEKRLPTCIYSYLLGLI